jgi:hypothetical protein
MNKLDNWFWLNNLFSKMNCVGFSTCVECSSQFKNGRDFVNHRCSEIVSFYNVSRSLIAFPLPH